VPSARPRPNRAAVLAISALLLIGAASGCSTTQEKADKQQARARHILEARAERQQQKQGRDKPGKQDEKGS
jgi:outer membrane protein assembly factor BamE (lipoprotein component of BamABCDE complex)